MEILFSSNFFLSKDLNNKNLIIIVTRRGFIKMTKYKITFEGKTKNLKNKTQTANTAYYFDKKGIKYEAKEYSKQNGRYGWRTFTPSNFCRRCGRALTDPKSVKNGVGPVCIHKMDRDQAFPESDNKTKILGWDIAQKVIESIPSYRRDKCRFCEGDLDHTVYYYEHDGGWFVESLGKKVWLWLECSKCGQQWSLTHLGVGNQSF